VIAPDARCILCGSPELGEPIEINDGWHMRVCANCEAGTTWPRPTDTQVSEYNVAAYPVEERVALYSRRAVEFDARADQLIEYLPAKPGSILDFGCNVGFFLGRARTRGIQRVAGVEINDSCREWAASALHLDVRRDLNEFGDERFDVITFQDTLEHLTDPLGMLRTCAGHLTPGGVIFLQLPNRLSRMARDAGRRWNWYSAPDHLMHMSPRSVTVAAGLSGLRVGSLRTVDHLAELWLHRHRRLPRSLVERVGRLRGLRKLRPRKGDEGGLIQAVLVPIEPSSDDSATGAD
jgi:SAM-dependent methyltransferase